jgi:hypothetical protein
MQNLKFIQMLLLSNSQKAANQFKFSKTLNLITAQDNSVGKSTLLKLLFWGFGCEPEFDTTWKAQDSKTIIEFEISSIIYKVKRYKNQISLKISNNPYTEYSKITGEYSIKLAEILNFKALLPNQHTKSLETPPPAYYFLPFYIDQKRSWAKAWDNFDSLGQYSDWKSTIIKYHVGLLTQEHFEIESEKAEIKLAQKGIEIEVEKINTALDVVEGFIPQSLNTVTDTILLDKITESIKIDLLELQKKQELLLNEISLNSSEKTHLTQQKIITQTILSEIDLDYKFSVENIEDDIIECPLCGTIHENSVVNRASILTDKSQAENQLQILNNDIEKVNRKITKCDNDLNEARKQIDYINSKYLIEDDQKNVISFNQIIESIAGKSIRDSVNNSKSIKIVEIKEKEDDVKKLNKEQKDLVTKEMIDDRNETFISLLTKYIKILDAETVNLSEINSPLDYNKIVKEGGAAESVRAILGYYLTIYTMVRKYGNEVKSTLVIDTPNQQEQSHKNYDKIINLLVSEFTDEQIIMSAMENEHIKPFAEKANVITLDKNKLLSSEKYITIKPFFDEQ